VEAIVYVCLRMSNFGTWKPDTDTWGCFATSTSPYCPFPGFVLFDKRTQCNKMMERLYIILYVVLKFGVCVVFMFEI